MGRFKAAFALIALFVAPVIAAAQPRIQAVEPAQGPTAGGTQVTLTGSGFAGTTLTLDRSVIQPESMSDTRIVFRTPARENGIASIAISGTGPRAHAEFLYRPPSLQDLPAGYITTVMGIGEFRGDGRPATSAMVDTAEPGFALAADGSLYFSEHNRNVVRRIGPDGVIERHAGTGVFGYSGDGRPATQALFQSPRGLAIDAGGNLLIADANNNCIRRIDAATGIITTLYGGQAAGFSGDGGPATGARFNEPTQIAFDGAGNLFVLDHGNRRIRRIDTRGIITTIAGTGQAGFSGDGGPAIQATFDIGTNDMGGLAADSRGNVYLADTFNGRVRRIDGATGIISTFVENAGPHVRSVFVDRDDNLYVGINVIDSASARILKLSPAGQVLQSWGRGYGFSEDGAAAASAPLCLVQRVALDRAGNIAFADECSSRIRRIDVATGRLETLAGMGPRIIGETGPAVATVLSPDGPDLLFLPGGDLLTAEGSSFRIRRLDRSGNVTPFAGNGFIGIGAPAGAPALQTFMYPVAVSIAPNGDILVDNTAGISRIDSAGFVHAVNRLHTYGFSGDGGPAIDAMTNQPWDVAADPAGNVFIADSNNNRVRRIDARTGVIDTIAGSGAVNGFEGYGRGSYCGDGGPATQACLNTPYGIAVAPDGTLYIAENGQRIRKVTPGGVISTLFSGGGSHVRLSAAGNLFMGSFRIQPNGHAFPIVSQSSDPLSGVRDGVPAQSALNGYRGALPSSGVAIDGEGNLFLADALNRRVRAVRFGAVMAEPGSSVRASGGAAQATAAGTAFPAALRVTLTSPAGTPENGIRVDFAAPASGPSCVFPGGASTFSTLTDIEGNASATCTANSEPGSYSVTATPLALGQSAGFPLTNVAAATAANYTGLWYNFPAESEAGWGVNFTHQGSIVFATLFTYDSTGQPMWLVMSAGTLQSGTTFSGALYRTRGPAFNAVPFVWNPNAPGNLTTVGTMTVTFTAADRATLGYTYNGVSVTKTVTKQVYGSRAANCATTTGSRAGLTNYQDLWYNSPAESEPGWGVNITHQDNILFATLFTYDATGRDLWLVMSAGQRQPDGSYSGTLYRTTGPAFNANPFTPINAGNLTTVGTMRLSFSSGENGTLTYTYNGVTVTKSITRQVFSSPVPACS